MTAIKNITETNIKKRWRESIDKFIKHYVWHTGDISVRRGDGGKLWARLESRLIEMKERRKRLMLTHQSLKNRVADGKEGIEQDKMFRNQTVLEEMKTKELEEHLKDFAYAGRRQSTESTKNVAHEVISYLIDLNHGCKGILTEIIKWLKTANQRGVTLSSNRKTNGSDVINISNMNEKKRIIFNMDPDYNESRMVTETVYVKKHDSPGLKAEILKGKKANNSSFSTQGNFYKDGPEVDEKLSSKSKASKTNKSYDKGYLVKRSVKDPIIRPIHTLIQKSNTNNHSFRVYNSQISTMDGSPIKMHASRSNFAEQCLKQQRSLSSSITSKSDKG